MQYTAAPVAPRNFEGGNCSEEYGHLQEEAPIVEHQTIPGFLRRINHRWHVDDIARFGQKVGRIAETMHLAYMPTVDPSLGVLRSFPVPLLRRIYTMMAASHRWPELAELQDVCPKSARESAPTSPAAKLRLFQGVANYLRATVAEAPESEVRVAARVMLEVVDHDCRVAEMELEANQVQQMSESK